MHTEIISTDSQKSAGLRKRREGASCLVSQLALNDLDYKLRLTAMFPSTCRSNDLKFAKNNVCFNPFKVSKYLCIMTSHAVSRSNWYMELI